MNRQAQRERIDQRDTNLRKAYGWIVQRERIGQRITDLRKTYEWIDNDNVKHTGLTQAQLAQRCGLSQAHIARIEGGYYSVGFDKLQAIAEALDKNIDFI